MQFPPAGATDVVGSAHPSRRGYSDLVEVAGRRRPLLARVEIEEADDDIDVEEVVRELRPMKAARSIPVSISNVNILSGPGDHPSGSRS